MTSDPHRGFGLTFVICLLLVMAMAIAMGTATSRAQDLRTHVLAKDADGNPTVTILVESILSQIPLHGVAPFRVTAKNRLDADIAWKLRFESHAADDRIISNFKVESKKGVTTTVELLVPVATLFDSSSYSYSQSLDYSMKADGFPVEDGTFSEAFPVQWPAIIMSNQLSVRNAGPLTNQLNASRSGVESFAAAFELGSLPANWRGYSGVDVILLTDVEWLKLQAEAPQVAVALLEWNRLGGRLDIYSSEVPSPESLGIKDLVNSFRSFGGLNVYQWNGREFDPGEMEERYERSPERQAELSDSAGVTQLLAAELGKRSFGNWQVAVILIAFGIIVGPVNLFIFAKQGRRHRLFWTTPLISLIASLLLIVLILLQDGTGGQGERLVLVNVEAAETNAYVTQYQMARTGVLFSSAFEAKDVFVSQTALSDSPWSAVDSEGGLPKRYNVDGDVYGGDWFQSRREHGHFLQATRSTRGRVELASAPSQPPVIISSISATLDRLCYVDSTGQIWVSKGQVATGERATLQKASKDQALAILPDALVELPFDIDQFTARGQFIATTGTSDPVPDFAIETLRSIDWKDRTVFFGAVVESGR